MEQPGHSVDTSKKLEGNQQKAKKTLVSVFLNAAKYVQACIVQKNNNYTFQDDSASLYEDFLTWITTSRSEKLSNTALNKFNTIIDADKQETQQHSSNSVIEVSNDQSSSNSFSRYSEIDATNNLQGM